MTNILELLKNEKVEWKKLEEVANIQRGRVISKKYLQEHRGEFPVYSSQTKNDGIIGEIDTYDFDGEYITWTTDGAYAGTVFYRLGKFSITNICGLIKPKDELLIKYLYYWLQIEAKKYVTSGSGNPKLMSNVAAKIPIPIPSLEIQEKIVEILDKFTNYVTELQSELQSRTNQYTYYRDKLLSEEYLTKVTKEMEEDRRLDIVQLEEVVTIKNGKDWKKLGQGNIPVYGSGGEMGVFVDKYSYDKPTVLIPRKGSISNLFYLEKAFWNVDTIYYTEIDEEQIIPKYFYYYLTTVKLEEMATNPTRPSLTQAILDKIRIPVPSLKIQSRIVQVLDNFDMVCNDLNIGLPKEIELRQKQYEYFREKLLTFVAEGEYTDSTVQYSTVQYRQDIIRLLNWVFGPIKVELGALGDIIRGNGLQKKDFQDVGVPCIHYGQIYTYYGIETERTKSFINSELAKKLQKAKTGDLIVATTSENVEDVGKSLVWLGKEEVCIGGHSCIIRTEQNTKFLAYFFRTGFFQIQKEKRVLGTKVIELYPKNLAKIKIILPSLSEQERIVSILDHFNTLTNSLSEGLPKEIELRQKQYEYWRDELLHFHV